MDVEGWADPGDYTEEQLHQNLILDNNLYNVTPKSGLLKPGEIIHILLSYSHEFSGFHRLPVVFKLMNGTSRCGKEVLLHFVGFSAIPTKNFLQIPTSNQTLVSMPIGTENPPIQVI